MFTHSKKHSDRSSQHAAKPFFSQRTTRQNSGVFFTPIATPSVIQRKCAACNEEDRIQTKLSIGQPDDKYEREADAVADRVVSTPDADIQRQEIPEEEEEIQAKPIAGQSKLTIQRQAEEDNEEEETLVQAKAKSNTRAGVSADIASGIQPLQGGGQTLSEPARNFFGPRIGSDFSDVRIHTDSRAAHLARSINARAFTMGRDVVFGSGEYSPGTTSGKKLLAHELTHVVQQGGAVIKGKSSPIRHQLGKNILQRAVTETKRDTLAGLFELSKHDQLGGATFAPKAQYDVKLEFTPYQVVDCDEIAMTQTLVSRTAGVLTPPSAAQRSRGLTAAEGTEGVAIDRLSGRTSPLYGVYNAGTTGATAQFGSRTGKGKGTKAWIKDTPGYPGVGGSNRTAGDRFTDHFETCAICNKGTDENVYYGCVNWGFDIDASNKFTEDNFTLVSKGTPSSELLAAAKKWNAQTVPVATTDLPIPTHTTKQTSMTEAELKAEIKALKTTLKALAAGHANIPQITFEIKVYQDILAAMAYNRGRGYHERDVKAIQVVVGAKHNGVYDFDTIMKIKKWQVENSLRGDGRFGPKSKKKYDAIVDAAVKSNKAKGFTDEQIKKIQRKVGSKDDGDWGPKTVKRLMVWQKNKIFLAPNGVFNFTTQIMMFGFGAF